MSAFGSLASAKETVLIFLSVIPGLAVGKELNVSPTGIKKTGNSLSLRPEPMSNAVGNGSMAAIDSSPVHLTKSNPRSLLLASKAIPSSPKVCSTVAVVAKEIGGDGIGFEKVAFGTSGRNNCSF